MRSNQKLVCFYIMALMLLGFHDNLVLRTKAMDVQPKRRQLMDFFYILRGAVFFFIKLLLGAILIGIGAIVLTILITGLVAGAISFGPGVALLLIGSFALVGLGSHQVIDIKRVCFDHADDDDVYLFSDRRLSQAPNKIVVQDQGVDQPKEKEKKEAQFSELKDLDVTEFQEKSLHEIVRNNAQDSLESGPAVIRKIIEMNEYKLYLARGYGETIAQPLNEEDRQVYTEAIKILEQETTEEKVNFFKRRITRIVVSSAWQFVDDMEKEINPDKFEGKKKKEFEKLKAEAQGSDPKKKAKAEEKIKQITEKYLKLSEKDKEKLAQKFALKMYMNGLTIEDMKSNYVVELLSATFPKIYREKIKNRKEAFKIKIKSDPQTAAKFAEVEVQMENAEKAVLNDDTQKRLATIQNDDDKNPEIEKSIKGLN